MMKRCFRFCTVILAVAVASAHAGEIISLPTAAVSQQGKTSKFKQFLTMNSRITAQGKTLPVAVNISMFQTQKYGYSSNGLIPVTTSIAIGNIGGTVDGQSIASQMPKNFKFPPMPSITSYVTESGKIAKVKVTDNAKGKPKTMVMTPKMDDITQAMMGFLPPSGTLELGQPIRKEISLPIPGAKVSGQVTFVPLKVIEVGGEPVVEIMIDGDGSMSAQTDLGQVASSLGKSAGAQVPKNMPKMDIAGNGNMIVNGTMLIGLNSGEPVRQDIKITVFLDVAMMGQTVSGDMDLTIGGYRISSTTKVARR